jgi:hypothetical protein
MLLDSTGHPVESTPLSDREIADLMVEELLAIAANGPVVLAIGPSDFYRVVSLLQVAMRHPHITADLRETGLHLVDTAREYFAECPMVLEIISRGNDPACDRARDDAGGR